MKRWLATMLAGPAGARTLRIGLGADPDVPDPARSGSFAERWMAGRPIMMLDHDRRFWGVRARVTGFEPAPDGLIRFAGLRLPPGRAA